MKIIHISDTHFGNNNPAFDLEKLKDALNDLKHLFVDENTYMVVSGDITFKGNCHGYTQASDFFQKTWLENKGSRDRFLACPGNHDLCQNSFNSFNSFLYKIRRDNNPDFSRDSCCLINFRNITFLLVNSAYHLDHKYGLVDCDSLCKILEEQAQYITEVPHKVAVVHHHLVGVQKMDISTIRNASSYIELLVKYNFNLVLHGHQHAQATLTLTAKNSQMKIFSSRSLNFPTPRIVNGLSIITYNQNSWERSQKVLSEDNSPISKLSFHSAGK